ncbi:(2Fe-2S) ferredoxin domain-containing protein [Fusibacter ferrireducens]|uniref:NAD(P)H-dependent oxidoreductase subunit E n=1 Tax=Fusibacter ferrireducens TaxID=2785058 RepID=A0ABR9ZQF9_9FIRM|nr:NAD(P)H-dependent oxidoreductase subunit E [Fusibacter ferrireducens]MBF4692683.1 NAD(P)H-dependent oxidoreductase subunit E [Fusibacter ferrireducens]
MEIKVCIGSACHLKGSYDVIKKFQAYITKHQLEETIILKSSFCLGKCSEAVSVQIDSDEVISMTPDAVEPFMAMLKKKVI